MAKEIDLGAYSAYAIAVEHGYEGTVAEFAAQLIDSAANGALAQDGAERAETAAAEAAEILGSIPEDYTALAGKVGQLSEDIGEINDTIFDVDYDVGCLVNAIPGATYKDGVANVATGGITISATGTQTSYDSYYKVVEEQTKIWFENPTAQYVSLCVGNDYTETKQNDDVTIGLYCSDPIRYRKSDGNLPTKENPVLVPAGGVYIVSVTDGADEQVYGVAAAKTIKQSFADEVANASAQNNLHVAVADEQVTLTGKNYEVVFQKKATTQGYQWNIASLKGKGGNVLPSSTDIIGVLRYDGEDNFMGGIHGNESAIEFGLWSDGAQITEDGYYSTVRVWMKSHLYSVADPAQNAVDRYVMMDFNESGWDSRVTFEIIVGGTVKVAYASGLFAFNRADVDFAVSNLGAVDLTSEVRQQYSRQFKKLTVNFPDNLTVTFASDTGDAGFVTYRSSTESYKAYYENAANQEVSPGNYITGECKYTF